MVGLAVLAAGCGRGASSDAAAVEATTTTTSAPTNFEAEVAEMFGVEVCEGIDLWLMTGTGDERGGPVLAEYRELLERRHDLVDASTVLRLIAEDECPEHAPVLVVDEDS